MEPGCKELGCIELDCWGLGCMGLGCMGLVSTMELESKMRLVCKLACRLVLCNLVCMLVQKNMMGRLMNKQLGRVMGKLEPVMGRTILVGRLVQMGVLLSGQQRRNRIHHLSSQQYVLCHQVLQDCIVPVIFTIV